MGDLKSERVSDLSFSISTKFDRGPCRASAGRMNRYVDLPLGQIFLLIFSYHLSLCTSRTLDLYPVFCPNSYFPAVNEVGNVKTFKNVLSPFSPHLISQTKKAENLLLMTSASAALPISCPVTKKDVKKKHFQTHVSRETDCWAHGVIVYILSLDQTCSSLGIDF